MTMRDELGRRDCDKVAKAVQRAVQAKEARLAKPAATMAENKEAARRAAAVRAPAPAATAR